MAAPPGGLFNPSAARNRAPILAALAPRLTAPGTLLEIAAGTGQHAAFIAPRLPHLAWLPSDTDAAVFPSIAAWAAAAGAANVLPARRIDAAEADWGIGDLAEPPVAILAVNLLHIAPWAVCRGLLAGAGRHLAPGGLLAIYGPFFRDDRPAGEGNLRFDAQLRAENVAWGIRRLEAVAAEAVSHGLGLREVVEMPANNLLAMFTPRAAGQV